MPQLHFGWAASGPADFWIDQAGSPKAADPNGEHWGCVVRRSGTPAWVRLPGPGDQDAWTKAEALREAKQWLRTLPRGERDRLATELVDGRLRGTEVPAGPVVRPSKGPADKPYAHPRYWAAFILVGDPDRGILSSPAAAAQPAVRGQGPGVRGQKEDTSTLTPDP